MTKPTREWTSRFVQLSSTMHELIAEAWPKCREHFHGQYTLEQNVTNKLVVELRKAKQRRTKLAFLIQSELTLLEEDKVGDPTVKGIVDFAVTIGRNEDHYLAYECKWLCINTNSGYDAKFYEYLTQGLMRFVSAKYAQNFPIGSMVGYIFDGKAEAVNSDIQEYITSNATTVKLLSLSSAIGEKPTYFSSTHARTNTNIVVRHILLPFKGE